MILSQATMIGRTHRLMRYNCHDFAISGTPAPNHSFGLVLDGCGSKYRQGKQVTPAHSEVGAKLLGQFMAAYLKHHLPQADDTLLSNLYKASLTFLGKLQALFPFANEEDNRRFLASHLLCTVVGFVITPTTAVFFWRGDGHLCHNGTVITLETNNQPDYLAYQLLSNSTNGRLQTQILSRDDVQWLAVATDGWHSDLLPELAIPRPTLALQRWVNVVSKQNGRFEDDGAIVTWHQSNL